MTKEEIGNRLRQARLSSGKTQKEVANIIGRTQQIIGHWETGYSQPDANTIFVLCDIYGMSVDDVFGFNKNKVSVSDIKFLDRYHSLDQFGRETIDIVLERETRRVSQLSEVKKTLSNSGSDFSDNFQIPSRIISYYHKLSSVGTCKYFFDDIPTDTIEISDTPISQEADFAINVNGDSMSPDYNDGDKALIKKALKIKPGEIGLFIQGSNYFIRELKENFLIPKNKSYEKITLTSSIRLIGKVIGKV